MKSLMLLLSLLCSHLLFSQHHQDPSSVHGMLLFGKKHFYFSHLPMFHKPHDYQVIMEVELDVETTEAYLHSLDTDKLETVYTIVPEKFSLPEMIQNPKSFKVELFKGHFERGGELLLSGTAQIKEVLFFKKFKPMAQINRNQYFVIGSEDEFFLIHEIILKPDFDFVAKIQIENIDQDVMGKKILLPSNFVQNAQAGQSYDTDIFNFTMEQILYLETQDLSF